MLITLLGCSTMGISEGTGNGWRMGLPSGRMTGGPGSAGGKGSVGLRAGVLVGVGADVGRAGMGGIKFA